MLRVVVGHSDDPDSESAIAEVLQQCQADLKGAMPQAGILFAAIDFDYPFILDTINKTFPEVQLIGGTTDGEISSVLEFQQDSLTLMLFCSDTVEIAAGVGRNVSQAPAQAAQAAIAQAQQQLTTPPKLCLTVPEGLHVNQSQILRYLKQTLKDSPIPIVGGFAGDQYQFKATYQFYNAEILQDSVPVLLFGGNLLFSHGVVSGWQPLGQPSRVTKVGHNVVYEIDGQSALSYYRQYLGGLDPAGEYPLAVFERDSEHFYLRAPLAHNVDEGSVTFFGEVPDQSIVQITTANRDEVVAAAQTSIAQALERYPGKTPSAAVFFSCAGRRWLLGTRTAEEYQQIREQLPANIPACGFYAYGEIAPLQPCSETQLHNETFVSCLFGTAD
ncbi:MAG: hypothetical protein F6J87_14110 [Spirulina sp. SIO3F2]|nr:hypothetical protein [Spirulina sp. SIO3F2]